MIIVSNNYIYQLCLTIHENEKTIKCNITDSANDIIQK